MQQPYLVANGGDVEEDYPWLLDGFAI